MYDESRWLSSAPCADSEGDQGSEQRVLELGRISIRGARTDKYLWPSCRAGLPAQTTKLQGCEHVRARAYSLELMSLGDKGDSSTLT